MILPVTPGTYYIQAGGYAGDTATNILLTWTSTPPTVVDISNATTPWVPALPDLWVNIDYVVGAGNTGRLVGTTQTYWGSGGFSVPLDLNGNTLIIDAGWNTPRYATGAISGNGAVVISSNPDLYIDGSTGNTYTGTTTISDASVTLSKTSGDALCSGPITMNAGVNLIWAANDQISDSSDVALVGSGAVLNLAGHSDTIHGLSLDTGTSVDTGAGGVLTVTNLIVAGVTNAPGTYDSGNSSFVTGSGRVIVVSTLSKPEAPTGLTATAGAAQVDLLWNAGLNATGYLVQRSLTSNAFSTVVGGTADVNATNFTDTAVTNGVLYWYVVTSTNAAGESANSAPVSARPLPAVLPQPAFKSGSGGYVLHLDSGTATFTFDVMGGLQYRVESTEDLTPPITWTPIPGGWYPAVSNGTMQLSDPDATGTQRFYRIAVEVQP